MPNKEDVKLSAVCTLCTLRSNQPFFFFCIANLDLCPCVRIVDTETCKSEDKVSQSAGPVPERPFWYLTMTKDESESRSILT